MNGVHVDQVSPPTVPLATATALTLHAGPPGARPDGTLVPEVTTTLVPPVADDPDFWGVALRVGWAPTLRHQPAHRADTGRILTTPATTQAMPARAPAAVAPPVESPTTAITRVDLLHEPHRGPRPLDDLIAPEPGAGGAS